MEHLFGSLTSNVGKEGSVDTDCLMLDRYGSENSNEKIVEKMFETLTRRWVRGRRPEAKRVAQRSGFQTRQEIVRRTKWVVEEPGRKSTRKVSMGKKKIRVQGCSTRDLRTSFFMTPELEQQRRRAVMYLLVKMNSRRKKLICLEFQDSQTITWVVMSDRLAR
ncbi:hypothetical protein HanPI659440_Chr14g0546141 [Helianthus annuus]|nr:hypothetical protein HanPI659440_Chr14g0546141 [Helianthus annuus]